MSIKIEHPYLIIKARKPYCTKRTVPFQLILIRATGVVSLFRVCILQLASKQTFFLQCKILYIHIQRIEHNVSKYIVHYSGLFKF